MIPLIDGHLDLAWNALSFDRDQTLSVAALREREGRLIHANSGQSGAPGARGGWGRCTTSLPEMRKARIGICLATILARAKPGSPPPALQLRTDLDHASQEIAFSAGRGQLAYYNLLESRGWLRMIRDVETLNEVWSTWADAGEPASAPGQPSIGYVLSMEGADPIVEPAQAQDWWEAGLRVASLAHYGQSAYAFGTGGDGPVTPRGYELLKEFDRLGIVLDLTHTAHTAFFQALDAFGGEVLASHNNCQALVPGDRQFTDEQVKAIVARGGVIGAVLDAWMLSPGWKIGTTTPASPGAPTLQQVVDHIDRVCQLAGNAKHAAIGSDLDGGFGTEQTPRDLDTIADLQKLEGLLKARGYSQADVCGIFHGNWLTLLRRALPSRGTGAGSGSAASGPRIGAAHGMIQGSTQSGRSQVHAESDR